MGTPTDATLAAYQRAVAEYCAASPAAVPVPVADLLDAVIERTPPHGSVLEIGSGPGREALYLEERGLVVERTDATPGFVERLRTQGHEARLLDARDGDFGGPYDAVVAHAVFLHLERPDLSRALGSCLRATRPGGVLACTFKEGDGEAWSDAKIGRPRWFVYWREPQLRDVLSRAGWRVLMIDQVQGRLEPWLHVLCERRR